MALSSSIERLEDKSLLSSVVMSIDQPISSATDDAEENDSGTVTRFHTELELGQYSSHRAQDVGLRFTDVQIPEDAIIRRAYIQFTASGTSTGTSQLIISGERTIASETFEGTSNSISTRQRTIQSVNWSPADWNVSGEQSGAQATSDLTPIIQELLALQGWSSDSPITFLIEGDGTRVARALMQVPEPPCSTSITFWMKITSKKNLSSPTHLDSSRVTSPWTVSGSLEVITIRSISSSRRNVPITPVLTTVLRLNTAKPIPTWMQVNNWTTTSAGQAGVQVHSGTFPNLEYNTDYEYRIQQYIESGVMTDEWSGTFHTRLAKGDITEFSFAALGNSSGNPISNQEGLENTRLVMDRLNQTDAAFSLLVGNNLNPSGSYSDADGRFDQTINPEGAEWNASHIEYVSYGSNDLGGNSAATDLYFSSPVPIEGVTSPFYNPLGERAERNYSFDYGDTHFATFNSNIWNDEAQLDEVLDWLEKDMRASTAHWKVVFTSYPIAGMVGAQPDPTSNYYQQVVERLHAAGVDLFLTGESSTYSWTKPLIGEAEGEALYVDDQDRSYEKGAGLIQVTTGVGVPPSVVVHSQARTTLRPVIPCHCTPGRIWFLPD
ncbi:MAG: hypothetical protein R3C11_13715 [Planctomycetaceae bacterium]